MLTIHPSKLRRADGKPPRNMRVKAKPEAKAKAKPYLPEYSAGPGDILRAREGR